MGDPLISRFPDLEALSQAAAKLVVSCADESIVARGRFALALSGGNTPRRLYELLAESPLDWQKAHLFWGDERFVAPTDPASNFRMAREALLSRCPVPPQNVHPVPVDIGSPQAAAKAYEEELRGFFRGAPFTFDMALLGIGPDGHTASLFPGSAALKEKRRWALAVDGHAGQPPVPRITLTLPALNASREVVFLAIGAEKKPLIEEIMEGGSSYPAARVAPEAGPVWLWAQKA